MTLASPRSMAPLLALLIALPLAGAEPAEPGPPPAGWTALVASLRADPSLRRLYRFDEGRGIFVADQTGAGRLTVQSASPYGEPRVNEWRIWKDALGQDGFPLWSEGRWAGSGALRSGTRPGRTVSRSRYAGEAVFTIEAWVRMLEGAPGSACRILATSGGYNDGMRLSYSTAAWAPDGVLDFRVGTPAGPVVVNAQPFTAGVWHQVVAQVDRTAIRLLVDGRLAAEKPFAGPYVAPSLYDRWSEGMRGHDVNGLDLGGAVQADASGPTARFDIDFLAVYARALSAEEVLAHCEAGRPATPAAEQRLIAARQEERRQALAAVRFAIPHDTFGNFRRGEAIPVRIDVPAAAGLEGAFTAHVLVRDVRNAVVLEEAKPVAASRQADATATTTVTPPRCGVFFIDLWLSDAAGRVVRRLAEEYSVAVTVPLPRPAEIPTSSPFASHGIDWRYHENRFLGFGLNRSIGGWGPWNNPKPGTFDFTQMDKEMGFHRQARLKVLLCVNIDIPPWAERVPGKKKLIKDMAPWAAYLRAVHERYRDVIAAWEIQNEPNANGWNGAADEYVEFLKVAYTTLKELDRDSVVVGLCGCPGFLNWNEAVFKAGGARFFDVLSLHNYVDRPIEARRQNDSIRLAIAQLVKYRGERVPVWNSETGFAPLTRLDGRPMDDDAFLRAFDGNLRLRPGQPPIADSFQPVLQERAAAAYQVQSALLDLGDGCAKYFMLAGPSHYDGPGESGGQPSEMAPAVAALASVLIPARTVERLPLSSAADAGALITHQDGRRIAVVFSDERPTLSFAVGGGKRTIAGMDMLGNPLTFACSADGVLAVRAGLEPIYLLDVPEGFAQLRFLSTAKAPGDLPDSGVLEGELEVANPTGRPLVATLEAAGPPQAPVTLTTRSFELQPGARATVGFRLDGGRLGRRAYAVDFVLVGADAGQLAKLSLPFNSEGGIHRVAETSPDARPGDGRWWTAVEAQSCTDPVQVVHGEPVVGAPWVPQWRGAQDLSFTLRTAWSHDGAILFRIEVTDDTVMPAPPEQRGRSFLYDGIELFLDGRSLAERATTVGPGVEQVLIIPNAGSAAAPCDLWFGGPEGSRRTLAVEALGARSAAGYWIEGAIRPAAGGSLRVRAGSQFALDVLVDDTDSAKEPRKAAMALHGIFADYAAPGKWGRYQLEPAPRP